MQISHELPKLFDVNEDARIACNPRLLHGMCFDALRPHMEGSFYTVVLLILREVYCGIRQPQRQWCVKILLSWPKKFKHRRRNSFLLYSSRVKNGSSGTRIINSPCRQW